MRRVSALASSLAAVLVFTLPASAGGGTHIAIVDSSYSPSSKTVPVATEIRVTWDNGDGVNHTSTSDRGDFIDTITIAPGTSGSDYLYGSGTYPYHCSIHSSMHGTFKVRPTATAAEITVGQSVTVTYGNAFSKGIEWDVQRRRNGGAWATPRSGTLNASLVFTPTRTGTFEFRARTHDLSGHVTGWSPIRKVTVTAAP